MRPLVTGDLLPVELTSFYATYAENEDILNWQTATEINNYGFEIERSYNSSDNLSRTESRNWENIGFVSGHGNSNSPKNTHSQIYQIVAPALDIELNR